VTTELCKTNILGTRWMVCGAPAEGPCYCDVVVIATPPTPVLRSLPIWPQLLCLHREHTDLKACGLHVAARAVKEQALGLVEGWFDGEDQGSDWLAAADDQDQIAFARAHVSATLARWQFEIKEGAPF
jgi:hypothetical protein